MKSMAWNIVGMMTLAMVVMFMPMTAGIAAAATSPALATAEGSAAKGHNDEGIMHYNKEHWDKAEMHFREAVKTDAKSAESHYNLALSLDKLGRHKEASAEFQKALDLGKANPDIANSGVLKKHLGM